MSHVPSCNLRPFVTKNFLRKRNLHLVDLKCKLSQVSKNCAPTSTLSYQCRKGFKFGNNEGDFLNYKNALYI